MKCPVLNGTAAHRGHVVVVTSVNNAGGDSPSVRCEQLVAADAKKRRG